MLANRNDKQTTVWKQRAPLIASAALFLACGVAILMLWLSIREKDKVMFVYAQQLFEAAELKSTSEQ